MKISTFPELANAYEVRLLDSDDLEKRQTLLARLKHSVIFEGDFLEFDNIINWIKDQLSIESVDYIFYGKLGYDYGFFELFFSNDADANKLVDIIPAIYTSFPNGSVMKSNGVDHYINKDT